MRASRGSAWSFLRRPRVDQEVDEELTFHVEMTIQTLVGGGMTASDARAEAVRRFGDLAVVSAECRRLGHQRDRNRSRSEYIAELRQDIAFAVRQLGRARGFAATATITLGLGIGATAAVFSVLYAVVLKPLPFADPDRVVQIFPTQRGATDEIASGAEFSAMRDRRDAFAGVSAAVTGKGFTLTGMGVPEVIGGSLVTAEYFQVLGVAPSLGRGFVAGDDAPGSAGVAVISHRLFIRRFASDTSVVGRRLRLEEEPVTVVGVMPAAFDATGTDDDMWMPLRLSTERLANNSGRYLRLTARLAPGVTVTQAMDAASAAEKIVAARTPTSEQVVGAIVRRSIDVSTGGLRERLLVLLGAVGFVLLIACVNVANLVLARSTVRARELAIRAALGAGRGRLVRQLLAETFVLGCGGAALGIAIAYGLVAAIVAFGPDDVPRLDQASVNGAVLSVTFAVAITTSVLVGLVPALRGAGPALQSALRDGGRGAGTGAARDRVRAVLVSAEVALAMTLLVGAGLLIRTAWRLQHVDPGFTASHVMTARLLLPAIRYSDPGQITRTYEQILNAAERVPGVQHAGLVSAVPLSGNILGTRVAPEGKQLAPDELTEVDIRYSSPDYFAAMGMSLLDGRKFTTMDDERGTLVAVISASLAHRLWPGERAIGKRVDAMRVKRDTPNLLEVVGVVADVRETALNKPVKPTLYMPVAQTQPDMWAATGRSLVLVARTLPAPEAMEPALQRAVMTVDASLPLVDQHTMDSWLSKSVATARFNTLVLATIGALALVLAGVGVYGVVAYFVSQRTREIGVRMALGATPGNIWQLVLRRGLGPIAWGALAGAGLTLATTGLLREQLYGVTPADPLTLVVVAGTLLSAAVVASFVPARRAMRVMPARALASE